MRLFCDSLRSCRAKIRINNRQQATTRSVSHDVSLAAPAAAAALKCTRTLRVSKSACLRCAYSGRTETRTYKHHALAVPRYRTILLLLLSCLPVSTDESA